MQNQIKLHLKFKDYEFRRITRMGNNTVAYTDKSWVGKEVLIIPVPITVTDRWIEKQEDFDETLNEMVYDVTIEPYIIMRKMVSLTNNIGRIYLPKELLGLDCLIIEAPINNNF